MYIEHNQLLPVGARSALIALVAFAIMLPFQHVGLISLLGFLTATSFAFHSLICFSVFGVRLGTFKLTRWLDRRAHS